MGQRCLRREHSRATTLGPCRVSAVGGATVASEMCCERLEPTVEQHVFIQQRKRNEGTSLSRKVWLRSRFGFDPKGKSRAG